MNNSYLMKQIECLIYENIQKESHLSEVETSNLLFLEDYTFEQLKEIYLILSTICDFFTEKYENEWSCGYSSGKEDGREEIQQTRDKDLLRVANEKERLKERLDKWIETIDKVKEEEKNAGYLEGLQEGEQTGYERGYNEGKIHEYKFRMGLETNIITPEVTEEGIIYG
jgi:flagellar biosynthesis/type III secretory pathway protein FliH